MNLAALPEDTPPKTSLHTLRSQAERQLHGHVDLSLEAVRAMTPQQTQLLLHELHVHQIELEMQNEELRQAKDALDASRTRYIALYDLAPVGYCNVNEAGLIVQANLTLATLLGVVRSVLTRQVPFSQWVAPEDQDIWYLLQRQLLSGGAPQTCELRMRLHQNAAARSSKPAFLWVQLAVTVAPGASGEQMLHLAVSDISARKQSETKLQLAASVFDHAREGIFITDPHGTILDVNASFTRITGYSRAEALGKNPRLLKSDRQQSALHAALLHALSTQGHWSGEIWNRRKNGEVYAHLQTISAVRDAHGKTQQYVALFSDNTTLKAHQSHLEHIAHFDALTNLPNRLLLADRLNQAMAHAQRRSDHLAVVYLDLDGFKAVNDRYGHGVGDQLLIAMANAMKDTLREGDTLARIGGDELVAVLVDLESTESCVPLLTRLLHAAATPVVLGDLTLQCTTSMGVSFYPQDLEVQADHLLRQADQALYQAKLAGKNRYHVFDTAQDSHLRGHHESLQRIRLALARHEFVLHYQPKVNMRSGRITGAEALIRWQHPDQGLLAPITFLPAIENHPLALEVGEWVIDTALRQIETWQDAGLDLPVSVNISAYQLQRNDFFERLQAILAKHPQVNPSKLGLEVLETSALADMAQISQLIEACEQIGVQFALDDFGTGYSSLIYLKNLRVAQLKIDQGFVRDMLEDPNDMAILKGVIGLASAFKREVIAEGVETVEHGIALLQLGCELAQGNGIAASMPGSQLPSWAASWRPYAAWCAPAQPYL